MDGEWTMSDEFWCRVQPLLPPRPQREKGGRPPQEDRLILTAILYRLRTGCAWRRLPRAVAAPTTAYDRYRRWLAEGIFDRLQQVGLQDDAGGAGLDWARLRRPGNHRSSVPG